MWFLWIVITLLVLGISGTQVFSFFYMLFNFQEEYNNVTPTKRTSMVIGIIIHSIIMITWIILCFVVEAINRYWLVLLFTWIVGICFTIYSVKKNGLSVLMDLLRDSSTNSTNEEQSSTTRSLSPAETHSSSKSVFFSTAVAQAQHDKFRDLYFNGVKKGKEDIIFDPRARTQNETTGIANEYLCVTLYNGIQQNIENDLNISHVQTIKTAHFESFDNCKFVILEFHQPRNFYESKYIILAKVDDELKYYTFDKMIGQYDIYEWFNSGMYDIVAEDVADDIDEVLEIIKSELDLYEEDNDLEQLFAEDEDELEDYDDEENEEDDIWQDDIDDDDDLVKETPIINMLGQVVNEKTFAEGQKQMCGFFPDWTFNEDKYNSLKAKKDKYGNLTVDEESKLIFPLIFGNFNSEIDLEKALSETKKLLNRIIDRKPKENLVRENDLYMDWLREYAIPQILLGTIYTYQQEYIKAAYHFMLGLKTEQVAINMPYCDFIKYVLGKLHRLVKYKGTFYGCGFNPDNPMGSCGGTMLIVNNAMKIISEMEGNNGEVIVARLGNSGLFGYLERKGSTCPKNSPHPIDIYETYLIDSDYNIKKISLYFNGYFNVGQNTIKIANGFKIKSHSVLWNSVNIIESTDTDIKSKSDNYIIKSFKKQLISDVSKNYFSQVKRAMDDMADNKVQTLLDLPFISLQDYLRKCETDEDEIQLKFIFIEHLIQLSIEIKKGDVEYWGFVSFMEITCSNISQIFDEVINYIADNITIEYDMEEETMSVTGEAQDLFDTLDELLSENESFLKFGGAEMSAKWYALLNNQL